MLPDTVAYLFSYYPISIVMNPTLPPPDHEPEQPALGPAILPRDGDGGGRDPRGAPAPGREALHRRSRRLHRAGSLQHVSVRLRGATPDAQEGGRQPGRRGNSQHAGRLFNSIEIFCIDLLK